MLAVLQFDSASVSVLDRLLAAGDLPTFAALRERGRHHELVTPADHFAAGAFHTLYSGVPLHEHGLFYPFQWIAEEQRARYMSHIPAPRPVWEELAGRGRRTLAIDPYESRPPSGPVEGALVSGWQLRDRVVLRPWSSPPELRRRLVRLHGRPPATEEVFGRPRLATLMRLRRELIEAPGRVAAAAETLLGEEDFDLVWLTFSAAHIAGHQFFDLSQVGDVPADAAAAIESALPEVYRAVDAAFARVLALLPEDADVIVTSPVGMEENTSRADLLPEMLAAVLGERDPAAGQDEGDDAEGAGAIWRLRAAIPPELRGKVASALPDRIALDLTSRLELRGMDWSRTRAFAQPADNQGYVRLNLRGRERDGTVDPAEAEALLAEITEGLATFRDPDGSPAVAGVDRVSESYPDAEGRSRLPDLVVRWAPRAANDVGAVHSERFGVVRRRGAASGRSGNHTEGDAWTVVAPGASAAVEPTEPPRIEDIAATAAALLGGEPETMAGTPLLTPR